MASPAHDNLTSLAEAFRVRLNDARSRITDFQWYPYDTLGGLQSLDALLGPDGLNQFRALIGTEGRILDFGCGDGDLSFLFEHLGYQVDALDNPNTNYNSMAGVRRLKEELQSKVAVHSLDADQQFTLPSSRYSLGFCLGVLYHIKNPYYLLESLAAKCSYLILSTRVTSTIPGLEGAVSDQPVAYLLGKDELNDDDSNFWIFTEKCLLRLFERTQWQVEKYKSFRLRKTSDPHTIENDERAFVLLRSVYGLSSVKRLYGWHEADHAEWCWTERRFGVRLDLYGDRPRRHKLVLKLFIPPEVLEMHGGSLRLEVSANGAALGTEEYFTSGKQMYVRSLPAAPDGWNIECSLDKALAPSASDLRELGIIVAGCAAEVR